MIKSKKHSLTFSEFLKERKTKKLEIDENEIDWEERKTKWIKSVNKLYKIVDEIIVKNFKDSGYIIECQKETVNIYEEYIGSYEIENYIIRADNIKISFYPIGTLLIGAVGRVNMLLPKGTIKLIMNDWDKWMIVKGIGSSLELVDFNEENIFEIFQENI